jgi:hypothetical protein
MRYVSTAFLVASALMLPTAVADADPITFIANLSGANQNPANDSPATGRRRRSA